MSSLADYKKTEIVNGVVYNMSPANLRHIAIQRNLSIIIGSFLKGKRCKLFTEAGVTLDENNFFIPDLVVVCDPAKITYSGIKGAPDFVVEVLSLSTKRKDISEKKAAYEKFGVREYWIIDPKAESIEAYILREGRFELDGVYHNVHEEEMEHLDEEEKAEIHVSLKISLYDDLVLYTKDIFEF